MSGPNGVIDCVVVGAGPAGLAASIALTARGVEHVVLERGRVLRVTATSPGSPLANAVFVTHKAPR